MVILVDRVATLTFDVKNERVIEIGDEGNIAVDQAEDTKNELKRALDVVLDENYKPSSLITETATVQNLEELAPENAEASGIASIEEKLDQVYIYLANNLHTQQMSEETELKMDLRSLTRFIARTAAEGKLERREIESLITEDTSLNFDRWVNKIADSLPETVRPEDFDDIPF